MLFMPAPSLKFNPYDSVFNTNIRSFITEALAKSYIMEPERYGQTILRVFENHAIGLNTPEEMDVLVSDINKEIAGIEKILADGIQTDPILQGLRGVHYTTVFNNRPELLRVTVKKLKECIAPYANNPGSFVPTTKPINAPLVKLNDAETDEEMSIFCFPPGSNSCLMLNGIAHILKNARPSLDEYLRKASKELKIRLAYEVTQIAMLDIDDPVRTSYIVDMANPLAVISEYLDTRQNVVLQRILGFMLFFFLWFEKHSITYYVMS